MIETIEKELPIEQGKSLTEEKLREIRQTTDWEEIQQKLEEDPDWKRAIDRLYDEAERLLDERGAIDRGTKLKEVTSIVGESVRGSQADRFHEKVKMLLEQVNSPDKI